MEKVRLGLEYPCRQCSPCDFFPSLEEAVAELTAAGIEVLSAKIGAAIPGIAVCAACGCPSNRAYWVEVPPGDAEAAMALGWRKSLR